MSLLVFIVACELRLPNFFALYLVHLYIFCGPRPGMATIVKLDASVRELITPRGNMSYNKWWKLISTCMSTRLGGGALEPYIPFIYLQIKEEDRAGLTPDCTLRELEEHIKSLDRSVGTQKREWHGGQRWGAQWWKRGRPRRDC